MTFNPVDLVREQDELRNHTIEFVLCPKFWKQWSLRRTLKWKIQPLDKSKKGNIPEVSGIYTLLIQPLIAHHPACSYLTYVGQAKNLRKRFHDYCTREKKVRPKIVELLYRWDEFIFFCFCNVPPSALNNVEKALLSSYIPPANSDFPGTIQSARKAF